MSAAELEEPVVSGQRSWSMGPGEQPGPVEPVESVESDAPVEPVGLGESCGPEGGRWRRWRAAIALGAVPLAIFVLTRAVQFALIAWLDPERANPSIRSRLLSWDVGWFVRVARDGYPDGYTYGDNGDLTANGLAFFPGFPMLVRAAHALGCGSYETSALVAGSIAGCLATLAVYALGTNLYDHRVGVALATLFCAQPMSVVLSMGYSEGLFVAFVAAAMVAAYRDAWLLAGLLGLGAALSRPTGAGAALALALAAYLRLRRPDPYAIDDQRPWPVPGRVVARWRPVLAAVLALAGVPGYLLWVGLRVGSLRAWFDIQTAGWGTTFDFGTSASRFVTDALRGGESWVAVSVAWILVATLLLAFVATAHRVWPPLLLYGLISLVMVIGQAGFYHSKPRLLVPVLVILVPVAVGLGRARLRSAVPALIGYSLFGLWYGAYMLTVWHFAI